MSSEGNDPEALWPRNPYKGLSYYTPKDAALFGGRAREVRACARKLVLEDTRALLLHGTTGCGKSSFLRAGLIPFLESEAPRFKFLRTFAIDKTKALFVRCTDQPLFRLAETLFDWGGSPLKFEPPDAPPEEIDLRGIRGGELDRIRFVERNGMAVEALLGTLTTLDTLLPNTLVIVLDQAEEVLTMRASEDGRLARDLFFDFVGALSRLTLDLRLVIALRTEYFGMFDNELDKRRRDRTRVPSFLLSDLESAQLVEAIKMPTSINIPHKLLGERPQPFHHYGFAFESGLPELIVEELGTVETKGGVLPILQIVCANLYEKANGVHASSERPWTITRKDYDSAGRLDDQVDAYVEEKIIGTILAELPTLTADERNKELAAWKDVLYDLVVVESDNRALTLLRPREFLLGRSGVLGCRVDFDKMMASLSDEANRILRPPQDLIELRTKRTIAHYSLGHDAIAIALSKWPETRRIRFDNKSPFVSNPRTPPTLVRYNTLHFRRRCRALNAGSADFQAHFYGLANESYKRRAGPYQPSSPFEDVMLGAALLETQGKAEEMEALLRSHALRGNEEVSRQLYWAIALEKNDFIPEALEQLNLVESASPLGSEMALAVDFNRRVCYEKLDRFDKADFLPLMNDKQRTLSTHERLWHKALCNHLICRSKLGQAFDASSADDRALADLVDQALAEELEMDSSGYVKLFLNWLGYRGAALERKQIHRLLDYTNLLGVSARASVLYQLAAQLERLHEVNWASSLRKDIEQLAATSGSQLARRFLY